jgi:restriction endonuclease S subunit
MINTTVKKSDIRIANRLDAEYFDPKFFRLQKKLKKKSYKKLHELCEFIRTGPAGSALPASSYVPSGIKVYRPSNINGWNCDNASIIRISKKYCQEKNIQLYSTGDVVVTRIGDIKFGIIEENNNTQVAISPNMLALRSKKKFLDPYFLLAFLNTNAGFEQIHQGTKIVSLASRGISQIANILVPSMSSKDQTRIGDLVRTGLHKQRQAKLLYSQTENIFLQTIGFKDVERNKLFTIKNISELRKSRRADAEYFLQKNKLQKLMKTIQIEKIARVLRGKGLNRKAYQEIGKLFLRVSNISKYGLLEKSQKYISIDLYEKLQKKYQPRVGEILLVKDGKPGVAYVVEKLIEGIISEGIVRLKLNTSLAAEYISLCINSPFCEEQILRDRDGTLVPHWKVEQIKKLQIPLVQLNEQLEYIKKVKKSNQLFEEGNNNLQHAKELITGFIYNF